MLSYIVCVLLPVFNNDQKHHVKSSIYLFIILIGWLVFTILQQFMHNLGDRNYTR
jgi:hypothetical membrane protein